jgi:hypothetical protein
MYSEPRRGSDRLTHLAVMDVHFFHGRCKTSDREPVLGELELITDRLRIGKASVASTR